MGRFGNWLKERKTKRESENFFITKLNDVLQKMEIPEIKDLWKNLIGSVPSDGLEIEKSRKKSITFTGPISRKDYKDFIEIFLEREEITFDTIKNYLIRHRFTTERFFKQDNEEYLNNNKDEFEHEVNFEHLIKTIQNEFRPEKVYDEKELQNLLRHFLQTKFPNAEVRREVLMKNKDSIDIVVNDKYAFELKIPNDKTELRNLKAQLEEYKEEYPDICAVIVDNTDKRLTQQILEYTELYQKSEIYSVVIDGTKRG